MLRERKALFNQLRFGQEDRREYVSRLKSNLTRDLFSTRNIHDSELFTKAGPADKLFIAINEKSKLKDALGSKSLKPLQTFNERLTSVV